MRATINLFLSFAFIMQVHANLGFRVIRQWKYINFTWPDEETYRTAVANGDYIPKNNIIAGIKYFKDDYYITLPRMKNGVPATLARIPAGFHKDTSPPLSPFPNWSMNVVGDCSALQNVQNVEIDTKDQLWIIDGGRIETLNSQPIVKCPPKLLIYNLRLNQTTSVYTFPEDVASTNGSFLYDIVVDNTNGVFAYITDNGGKDPGIIVYSVKENRSWKIRHSPSMKADPTASQFRVKNIMLAASINIASIALGPKIHNNDNLILNADREVFYCPLSSLHLYSINASVLRNEGLGNTGGEYQGEIKDYGLKASQTIGMVMDNTGNLYYSLQATSGIAKWNYNTSFQTGQRLIAKDEKYLEWPNSFTFDSNGNLTVLVNKLNQFIFDKIDLNEYNYYLISAFVDGKSYLYDENKNFYATDEMIDRIDSDPGIYELKDVPLITDQDPYLAPKLEHDSSLDTNLKSSTTEHLMMNDSPNQHFNNSRNIEIPNQNTDNDNVNSNRIVPPNGANGNFINNHIISLFVVIVLMLFV